MLGRKFIMGALGLVLVNVGAVQAAKSVFIISKHVSPSQAQAYRIDGDQITLQANVDIHTYNPGAGAVGNAVWPQKELMFVTYETSPMVVWASTKTLQKVGEIHTDIDNPAGIAVDQDKGKIYIVWRNTDDSYVYSWDDVNETAVLNNHYALEVPSGSLYAWGIALDEINDWLYVSTNTERVYVYDTNDWSHDHYIDVNVGGNMRDAVGIAVDPNRGYLYTGHWKNHNYLVRTNTSSPYTSTEVEIIREGYPSKELIGVDVDEDTGLVYCTTYHDDFRVYDVCDSNLVLKDTEVNNISRPAGVAVGGLYKPPLLILTKDDNDVSCVVPGEYITYTISYDANGHDVNDVNITDYLPEEVDFNSASGPNMVYDSNTHTVTWSIGTLSPTDYLSKKSALPVLSYVEGISV